MDKQQFATEAAKGSVPVGMTLFNHLSSMPAEKWLTYLTIGYVVLQAYFLVRNNTGTRKGGKKK